MRVLSRRDFLGAAIMMTAGVLTSCSEASQGDAIPVFKREGEAEAVSATTEASKVRIAFAALVSPQESFYKYQNLVGYIEDKIGRPVDVIRKQTYAEVNEMLESGEVDFGFICSLSYVMGMDNGSLTGIAVPIVNGLGYYQSYLIVRSDSGIRSLEDLEGKTFAFTDPLSYSGHLSMLYLLKEKKSADESFFKDTFFTYSHDSSIQAVHKKIADAASVDSIVFDELARKQSEYIQDEYIIYKGPYAGMPPVVASHTIDESLKNAFAEILLTMADDRNGMKILSDLGYDKFAVPDDSSYDSVREALEAVGTDAVSEPSSSAS